MDNQGKYDDIVNLPRPVSEKRARMSMLDRGAQFSPFAALVGYDAAIAETARLTDFQLELTEGAKADRGIGAAAARRFRPLVSARRAEIRRCLCAHRGPGEKGGCLPGNAGAGGCGDSLRQDL